MAPVAEVIVVEEQMNLAVQELKAGTGHQLDVDRAAAQKALVQDERQEAVAALWMAKINLAHAQSKMRLLVK